MRSVVYDAGPLIAGARNDRRLWAEHRARLEIGILPYVPAPIARLAAIVTSDRRHIHRLVSRAGVTPRIIDL